MPADLRSFLEQVQRQEPRGFYRVSREIDPRYEMAALVTKLEQQRRVPVLLFERVRGARFPAVVNCFASRERLARALGVPAAQLPARYQEGVDHPIPPKVVERGPVQAVVEAGDAVDLTALPLMMYHDTDRAPYITAGIVFARDPESGRCNLSYNRLMLRDRAHLGIFMTVGKHLHEIYSRMEARGRPLPIAIALGNHPAWALGALYIGPYQVEEAGIIGGLLGSPLELVAGKTQDVLAPAHAEIVLEAEILPHVREEEGPFGEFHGYATAPRPRQVVRVTAITHREDAIYQDVLGGSHREHLVLPTIPMEANLDRAVRAVVPTLRAARMAAPFTCILSMEKRFEGQPRSAILAAFAAELYLKHVIVVDEDVDPGNLGQVLWAMGTRVQAGRDVFIIPAVPGSNLDPSAEREGIVDKLGIDATAKPSLKEFAPRSRVPDDVMARIRLEDYLPDLK